MDGQNVTIYPASPGTNSCTNCGSINLGSRETCGVCGAALPHFSSALPPGEVIAGKFEIISLLGVGGMGEVYKVRHRRLEAIRCVKLMKKSLLEDDDFRARFVREARVATRLHHPNVAVVHDFDAAEDGSYFLVSEFIDGITLRQWRKRHGRFPLDLALHLVLQVLSGLRHIHSKGLLHRDISADNIMVTLDHDDRPLAKIIDLGIAKVVEGEAASQTATQVGVFVGNPKYASPEQLGMLGEDEAVDRRADLYCLSVVIYEMIAGEPPFTSRTPQGYVAKHLTEPPPRFKEIDAELLVPEGFEEALFKGLEKRRDNRYSSAKEFAAALRPFLKELDLDLEEYGEQLEADLPSHQEQALREVTPLPDQELPPTLPSTQPIPTFHRTTTRINTGAEKDGAVWKAALEEGSKEALEQYLREYPDGLHVSDARERLSEVRLLVLIDAHEKDLNISDLQVIAEEHHGHTVVGQAARKAIGIIESRLQTERKDWQEALAAGTAMAWASFIELYPDSRRIDEARTNSEEAKEFHAALRTDSEEGWEKFLDGWREGPHAEPARKHLESARDKARIRREREGRAWAYAETSGQSEEWRRFLKEFPDSERLDEARSNLHEAEDFERAVSINQLEQWKKFLQNWGNGLHAASATEYLEKLRTELVEAEYQRAIGEGTAAALHLFLERYSSFEKRQEAQDRLDELTWWEKAFRSESESDYKAYLDRWPRGSHAGQARLRLNAIEEERAWSAAMEQKSVASFARYLEDIPQGRYLDLAKKYLEEAKAFEEAGQDLEKLRKFLKTYPDGLYASEAGRRAEELTQEQNRRRKLEQERRKAEEAAWKAAAKSATSAAWGQYLEKFSDSHRVEEASRLQLEAIAFERADLDGSLASWRDYLKEWPSGTHAKRARSQLERLSRLEEEARRTESATTIVQKLPVESPAKESKNAPAPLSSSRLGKNQEKTVIVPLPEGTAIRPATGDRRNEKTIVAVLPESRPARQPRPGPAVPVATPARPALVKWLGLGAAVLLLVIIVILVMPENVEPPIEQQSPPPDSALLAEPNLIVDARPWARVTSIRSSDGTEFLSESNAATPLSLSVPPGEYTVVLVSPNDPEDRRQIQVILTEEASISILEEFEAIDPIDYFNQTGW